MWTVPHLSVTALTNLVLAPILYPSQVSASESVLLDLRSAPGKPGVLNSGTIALAPARYGS